MLNRLIETNSESDRLDNKKLKLLIDTNPFISIDMAEIITTLDKTTQYRERMKGRFPKLIPLTSQGRRKGYRLQDLRQWMENPRAYRQ